MSTNDRPPTVPSNSPAGRADESSFNLVAALSLERPDLATIPSNSSLKDAIRLMLEKRYSQIPVVDGGECIGVISFASIARMVAAIEGRTPKIDNLRARDALDKISYISLKDAGTLDDLFRRMGEHEMLLVGDPDNLEAVLTPHDLLEYFKKVAGPYILAQEIELALRQLIRLVLPDTDFDEKIQQALKSDTDKAIQAVLAQGGIRLEDLFCEQLERIITHKPNWTLFEPFVGDKILFLTRSNRLRKTRDKIMHHKLDKVSWEDYDHLVHTRNTYLEWIRAAQRPVGIPPTNNS